MSDTVNGPEVPRVDVHEAKSRIDAGSFLLDVREPYEWEAGRIEGAVHIPMGTLPERREELPTDREILAVCRTDGRSGRAVAALRAAGYDAVLVTGGVTAWHAAGLDLVDDTGGPGRVVVAVTPPAGIWSK